MSEFNKTELIVRPPDKCPAVDVDDALQKLNEELDRRIMAPLVVEINISDTERLEELFKKKSEFLETYGSRYAPPKLPVRIRLAYDEYRAAIFRASDAIEMFYRLLDAASEIINIYEIRKEPQEIRLDMFRPEWQSPEAESRQYPPNGQWVPVATITTFGNSPYFDCDQLEEQHQELWRWILEYGRRSMNPCGEMPLVPDQKILSFLPKT